MRRRALGTAFVLLLAFAALPGTAMATPTNGNFGFGGKLTLGGVTGLDAIYWFGDFAIEGVFGFNYVSPESDLADDAFDLGLALGALYKVTDTTTSHFAFGGRFDILAADNSPVGGDDVRFGIEIVTRGEHFLSETFALNFEVGLALLFGDGTRFSLGETGLIAGGGFNYYFGGAPQTAQPAPATVDASGAPIAQR